VLNFLFSPVVFVKKLLDQRVGMFAIQLVKRATGDERDAYGNQRHGHQQRQNKIHEEFGAKRHESSSTCKPPSRAINLEAIA
jgi:hypothetical protein